MKFFLATIIFLTSISSCTCYASSKPEEHSKISILQPWIRESNTINAAAFMTFQNSGNTDKLIRVELRKDICNRVELHTHLHEGAIKRMRAVNFITLSNKIPSELKPGSDHIMLIGLKHPLKAGEKISMKFIFEVSDPIVIDVPVKPLSYLINGKQGVLEKKNEGEGCCSHGLATKDQKNMNEDKISPCDGKNEGLCPLQEKNEKKPCGCLGKDKHEHKHSDHQDSGHNQCPCDH